MYSMSHKLHTAEARISTTRSTFGLFKLSPPPRERHARICASVWGRLRAFCNLKRFFPSQQTGFSPSGDCKFSINPSRNPLANRGDRDRLLAGNGGKVAVYSIGQTRQGGIFACEESPSILCRSTSLGLTAIFSNDSTTPRGYQPSKTWHRDNYSRISASNAIIPRGSPEVAAFVFKSLLINVSKVESLVSRSDDIKKYIKGMFSRLDGRGEMAWFRFCDLCRATACFEQV